MAFLVLSQVNKRVGCIIKELQSATAELLT